MRYTGSDRRKYAAQRTLHMTPYKLYGAETSPYSKKVRAALCYKEIPFDWVARNRDNDEEFNALAASPTVPLLVSPDGSISQDSSRMLLEIEHAYPFPETQPDDPLLAALSLILEDYADEWLNKAMFQQRWGQAPDRDAAALRALVQMNGGKRPRTYKAASQQIGERMSARLGLVGAGPGNSEILVASFRRAALLLDTHLRENLFLFGGRPCAADFAMAAQFQQMLSDPTPAEWLTDRTPFLTAWCAHMEAPSAGGPFAGAETLKPTLLAFFRDEMTKTYFPWADANLAAILGRAGEMRATLPDGDFGQPPQKYAAQSFRRLITQFERQPANGLSEFLEAAGAARYFRLPRERQTSTGPAREA